jgi:protein-tyrosine phosphatase
VVDLRTEACDDDELLARHGVALLHLPTDDHCAISASEIDDGVAWVVPFLKARDNVYVHCEHGIGRSVLLCMCVLVELGSSPLQVLHTIKRARPCACPSPAQLEAFVTWCEKNVPRSVPSWQALADIAYASLRRGA